MSKLPKLGAPVKIRFWSLRNGVGGSLGVIFDIDTKVERKVRRVRSEDGWKWQIINLLEISEWDYFVEQDQEILDDDLWGEIEYEIV